MASKLLERLTIVEAFPPVDLQTGTAGLRTGDWVNLKNYREVAVCFASGLGTAGDDPTITIEQASSATGTGAKALNFTTIYRKQAATNLAAVASWTKTTQSAGNTYTNDTSAEEDCLWVVEFDAADLDVAGGFTFVRVSVNDVGGNAQSGYAFYVLGEGRHETAAVNLPTAIS